VTGSCSLDYKTCSFISSCDQDKSSCTSSCGGFWLDFHQNPNCLVGLETCQENEECCWPMQCAINRNYDSQKRCIIVEPEATLHPTNSPTRFPTKHPTLGPSPYPTKSPTKIPTTDPTPSPTQQPTPVPSVSFSPSPRPSATPSSSLRPSPGPSSMPSASPSNVIRITAAPIMLIMKTAHGELTQTESSILESLLEQFFSTGFRLIGCITVQFHVDVVQQNFVEEKSSHSMRNMEQQDISSTNNGTAIPNGSLFVNCTVALEYRLAANADQNNQLALYSRLLAIYVTDKSNELVNILRGSKQNYFPDITEIAYVSKDSELIRSNDEEIPETTTSVPIWMNPFILIVIFTLAGVLFLMLCVCYCKIKQTLKR